MNSPWLYIIKCFSATISCLIPDTQSSYLSPILERYIGAMIIQFKYLQNISLTQ